MALGLHEWLRTKEVEFCKENITSEKVLHRDPSRVCLPNSNYFYAPCDGTIIYQSVVHPQTSPQAIFVGTQPLTLKTILGMPAFNRPCLVIGLYVSRIDAKITRMPYTGIRQYMTLPNAPGTFNQSFKGFESTLLQGFISSPMLGFCFTNQRRLSTVINNKLNYTYYLVQTPESSNCIKDFYKSKEVILQNSKIDQVADPYMVDLVLPLSMSYDFGFQQSPGTHVKAGMDRLIQIKPKGSV